MAKKKSMDEELEDEFLNDSDDFFEEDDMGSTTPKTKDELADLLSSQLEEEIEVQKYKYLQVSIEKEGPMEFYVTVKGQSHGFMNYMVSKILKCSGVEFAAYKLTSLEPPKLYIRLEKDRDIKSILKEAVTKMRTEWNGMKNAVAAMKI